ncbi:MAG: patatin-like phospholipase family protein [Anaerolineales bacterium]
MQRNKIGLALGGGAVRGWAHLGVLSELLKAGVKFDYVAGSSVGSLVGAIFCTGMDFDDILEEASRISWWQFARPVWPSQGFLSFDRLEKWLVKKFGDIEFSNLAIPFIAMATDLMTGKGVPLGSGRLAPAVCASCAIPGLVVPVVIDGQILGDGCVADAVPVRVLRSLGADYVIGVDILKPSIRPRLGAIGMGLNALEILIENAGKGIEEADCLISPNLAGDTYIRFSRRESLFLLGEQAARDKLSEILDGVG